MNPTTTHSSEVVAQLVLIETDPISARVKHAIAGFLAGYSGTTLKAYRLDLRGWITWLDAAFLDPFAVERAHIELYARWSESEVRARARRRARRPVLGWWTRSLHSRCPMLPARLR